MSCQSPRPLFGLRFPLRGLVWFLRADQLLSERGWSQRYGLLCQRTSFRIDADETYLHAFKASVERMVAQSSHLWPAAPGDLLLHAEQFDIVWERFRQTEGEQSVRISYGF